MNLPAPPEAWTWSPEQIGEHQRHRLTQLWPTLREHPLYRNRLADFNEPPAGRHWRAIRPLTKSELLPATADQPSRLFTGEPRSYVRYHQTSGSRGRPMAVYDTRADWTWWLDCWDHVLAAAAISDRDTAMMAFSFGPFIGFWTANDSLVRRGVLVIPGGGLSSEARVQLIFDRAATVLLCTPSYAIRLASAAAKIGLDAEHSPITRIIVAGEPGGSLPAVRGAIEQAWGARVIDHAGASEIGAWGFGSAGGRGLHIVETEFIAEVLEFDGDPGGVPVADGVDGELVLTNLGRRGGPLLRYRTGDIVRRDPPSTTRPCRWLHLAGGVRGRADDMVVIRGVNVYPSSIESIVRELHPAAEYRVTVTRAGGLDQLAVAIECPADSATRLANRLRERLSIRVPVEVLAAGTLATDGGKAKRWEDRRGGGSPLDS